MRKRKKEDEDIANWLTAGFLIVLAMCALCWCTPQCDSKKAPEVKFAQIGQKVHADGLIWVFFEKKDMDEAMRMSMKDPAAAEAFTKRLVREKKAIAVGDETPLTVDDISLMSEAYRVFTPTGRIGWVPRWWVK